MQTRNAYPSPPSLKLLPTVSWRIEARDGCGPERRAGWWLTPREDRQGG